MSYTTLINTFALAAVLLLGSCTSEEMKMEEHKIEVLRKRKKIDIEFADPNKTPLEAEVFRGFKGLTYYPIDYSYRIPATIELTPDAKSFEMPTTTERSPIYKTYGILHFTIDGKALSLHAYQEQSDDEKDKDYLFIPFKDHTNGNETYGGGRFLDLKIPSDSDFYIDFNTAYNPYCAYNHAYSCPIPPEENHLDIAIPAGVKTESLPKH